MGMFDDIRNKLTGGRDGNAPMDTSDQNQEEKELAGFIKSKVEETRSQANRVAQEGIWMTNIAYLLGFDSVYYDPQAKQFRPSNAATTYVRRNRMRSNQLLPAAQNRLARMLKSPPKYDVVPNSMDEEDKEAARLGLEAINMVWNQQAINRKRIDLGMWIQQCGHAFIKVSFDPDLGDPLIDPQSDEIMGYEGAARVDVSSALECFADPLAKTLEEATWFAQCKVRKLDYFKTHYPERGDLVKEEGAWLLSAQYEMRINSLNSASSGSSGTTEQMKNAAIEISYYEKRSKKHPNGRHIIAANGVLLKNDELPFGEIPFAKFDDAVIGGKFYSEALLTHARPLQDQYNRLLEKRKQWADRLLAGKYIAAKGHGIIQEALNDQSGELIEYSPVPNAPEPHAVQVPVMPQYAYTESESIKKDLYDIMGISEISRGQLPSASIPAMGMQILLEQDETRIGIEVEQHEHAWARVGQLILKCISKNYVTDRTLKTKGKNLQYEIKKFTGEDLRSNFDVTVIRGSTVPNVKVLQRQEIMNTYSQGLLGDPNDPLVREKVLGMLEYGDVSEMWQKQRTDMAQISRTIKQIEAEEMPEVNKLDNHPVHMDVKNEYRKSEKFERLSPKSKMLLVNDIDMHAKAALALMRPDLTRPPDEGPPPEEAIAFLEQQAQGLGLQEGIDNPEIQPETV